MLSLLSSLLLLNITQSIEKELLTRLKEGLYKQDDIINYPFEEYNKIMEMEKSQPAEEEDEMVHLLYQKCILLFCVV